ncbi:MAG: DsbA family protein [Perlucidibaca sp.]
MSLLQRLTQPRLSALLTSPRLHALRRQGLETWRKLGRYPHQVTLWLRTDDPYAYLLLQALPGFLAQFPVVLNLRVLRGSEPDTTPEPLLLAHYGLQDARRLARWHGLEFPAGPVPDPVLVDHAERLLVALEQAPAEDGHETALAVLRALWCHDVATLAALAQVCPALPPADSLPAHFAANRAAQRELGHYASAMLHYAGEWYWGLDRLDHLAERLQQLGVGSICQRWSGDIDGHFLINEPEQLAPIRALGASLDFHFSFRSPYSWLALQRVRALAEHYGLALSLRPVLPMVMRGLPVPAKREADRQGIPFGRICDPVGDGVERCMAVCDHARERGRDLDFAAAAARMIWSEGGDMTQDRSLLQAAAEAGLKPADALQALTDTSWRRSAERSRQDLLDAGLWGVPGLVLRHQGGIRCVTWGQDRLWALEDALNEIASETRHD